jgi:hypothetical protein
MSPIVHASWNDTGIKISTNNITLLGGSDSSHILHQWAFLNYSARSHSPPLCLSRRGGISCSNVQLTLQISSAVGSLGNSTSQKHLYTIVKVGFPGCHPTDQRGPPGHFLFVLILRRNFLEPFLLGWIVPTQFWSYMVLGQIITCGIGHLGTLFPLKRGIG